MNITDILNHKKLEFTEEEKNKVLNFAKENGFFSIGQIIMLFNETHDLKNFNKFKKKLNNMSEIKTEDCNCIHPLYYLVEEKNV